MGDIRYLSDHDLATDRNVQRIVATAKADPGLWLMIKEREMEMRVHQALLIRTAEEAEAFESQLKPSLSELVIDLVTAIFGNCPPQAVPLVEVRLLEAAKAALDAAASGREHAEAASGKLD